MVELGGWTQIDEFLHIDYTKILGEGKQATVYLGRYAVDEDEPVTVAVKMFDLDKFHHESQRKHLTREISALKTMRDHPNIVTLYHVAERGSKIFMALEYATQGDLQSLLKKRKIFGY